MALDLHTSRSREFRVAIPPQHPRQSIYGSLFVLLDNLRRLALKKPAAGVEPATTGRLKLYTADRPFDRLCIYKAIGRFCYLFENRMPYKNKNKLPKLKIKQTLIFLKIKTKSPKPENK